MRTGKDGWYIFGCDKCKAVAGAHPSEHMALRRAVDIAVLLDWKGSFNEGSEIKCHQCKGENSE
jgi:hypothetical protein